jgi:hypothetical protein
LDSRNHPYSYSLFLEAGNRDFIVLDDTLLNFAGTTALRYLGQAFHVALDSKVEELASYSFSTLFRLQTFTCAEPSRLRVIRKRAFWSSESLATVVIPSTVEKIGKQAFAECRSLQEVVFAMHSRLRVIRSLAFLDCPFLQPVDVPYRARIWGEYDLLADLVGDDGAKRQRVRFLAPRMQA